MRYSQMEEKINATVEASEIWKIGKNQFLQDNRWRNDDNNDGQLKCSFYVLH